MRGPITPEVDLTTDPWESTAKLILRGQMGRRGLSYADLVKALAAVGIEENERNLRNKIARGTFSAVFFLQCLRAMNVATLDLEREFFMEFGEVTKSSQRPPRG